MSRGSREHRTGQLITKRSELRSFEDSCRRPDQAPPEPPSSSPRQSSGPESAPNASVAITRLLARAADSLGEHSRDDVADFLLRCAFTMFLSSLDIIPPRAITCAALSDTITVMWVSMAQSLALPPAGIFASMTALPLDGSAKRALIEADACDWTGVDLSIFGGLIENAFDPKQRHRLGAHYTPREYVMQLVRPTIDEPIRREWEALLLQDASGPLLSFHEKLCTTRVLDPACGAGNFLIVALETLYAIEDDVLREFDRRGIAHPSARVSPHQMRGIEINPRACEVCKLVLNMSDLRRRHARAA